MANEPTPRLGASPHPMNHCHMRWAYHRTMGFNPFRKSRASTLDVALVVGFVVLTLGLVAWGFFG